MNENEKLNTEIIRQMLDRSSTKLNYPTLEKLRGARELALARYDARSTAPAFVWAGAWSGAGQAHGSHRNHYYWASIVLVAALMFTSVNYLQHLADHDNSDVDIAILTDDLPIDVYVD